MPHVSLLARDLEKRQRSIQLLLVVGRVSLVFSHVHLQEPVRPRDLYMVVSIKRVKQGNLI